MSLIITAFLITVGVGLGLGALVILFTLGQLGLGALVILFTLGQLGLIWAMDRFEATNRGR
jgi:hypothetical protein